jgi:rhodanese-related sulfurtransferase
MAKTKASQKKKESRRWLWIGAGLGFVAVLVIVGAILLLTQDDDQDEADQQKEPSPSLASEISVDEAAALRDQGAFMLDVRQPEEWNEFHMPGATLIPLGELSSRLSEVPRDQQIVVVCRSGNRSAQGRDLLLSAGYEQVTSMAGGMTQWRDKDYPIETGS